MGRTPWAARVTINRAGEGGADEEGGDEIAAEIAHDIGQFAIVAQGRRGFADHLQRNQDQGDADKDAAELALLARGALEEQAAAGEQKKRRQPGQIDRQDQHHDGGAEIGAEHQSEAGGDGHDADAGKTGGEDGDGGRALQQQGDNSADACRLDLAAATFAQGAPQRGLLASLHAGSHHSNGPEQ
jgi:hypothetical protein